MSIKIQPDGRRSIEAEVEVPGTPEEVWEAIATGPGVSSWFVPTEMREDGQVVSKFGEGMEAVAKQTAWDPPRRFAAESPGFQEGAPPMATEWIVEAQAGGTCIVRVVHSLFASTDDWDGQLEQIESGWPWFFRILQIYLTHYRGLSCAPFRIMSVSTDPAPKAWAALTSRLGLGGGQLGHRLSAAREAPPLAGVVVRTGQGGHPHGLMLRLHEPAAGVASIFTLGMGGATLLVMDFYFYGDQAQMAAAQAQPLWQAWMQRHFPQGGQNG
jgi:uncharacterized protein YndB with AHSA1/START domain